MSTYYTKTGSPQPNAPGSSNTVRAEFSAIDAAFDKLPVLQVADANKVVTVNGTGTALTSSNTLAGLTFNTSAFNGTVGATTPSTGAFTTLTATSGSVGGAPVVTTTATQTLTNKTLNLSNNTLQATAAQLASAVTGTTGTGSLVFADSPALTGAPTAPTPMTGDNSTKIATTAFVTQTAFASTLPDQTGNTGKYLTTDGTTASWSVVNIGGGTVTSVGLTAPAFLSVSNSPITSSGDISLTLSGAALPATSGGTGQNTYAVGDILYASSTTALSKLAGVAAGNALISGGVGAAPAWGKISLSGTQAVSGTLPVGNGGTGAITLTGILKGNGTSAITAAVSGTDIKTINGTSILGSGDIAVGGGDVTTTGTQTLTNKTISGGIYSGVVDQTGSVRGGVTAVAALQIDCSLGNYFTKTISANSTFTFANAPASRAYAFTLELTHTSGTVTWPASVQWPNQAAPTLTTGRTHLFVFVTDDGGSRWRGSFNVNYTN